MSKQYYISLEKVCARSGLHNIFRQEDIVPLQPYDRGYKISLSLRSKNPLILRISGLKLAFLLEIGYGIIYLIIQNPYYKCLAPMEYFCVLPFAWEMGIPVGLEGVCLGVKFTPL